MKAWKSIGLFCFFICIITTSASDGDRSPFYHNCLNNCQNRNCTNDGVDFKGARGGKQELGAWLLQWSCRDECRYLCMWRTVQGFQERGWGVPKFHGKWPFVRVLGVQELGSVIGSLLNLAAHLYMYRQLRHKFNRLRTPLMWLWHTFTVVCVNAWIWSTIFHTRDTELTEFMDYACALSMVTILFVTAVVRVAYGFNKTQCVVLAITVLYYTDHVRYLYSGTIDYDYNMLANVVIGGLAVLLWSGWAAQRYRNGEHYVWRLLLFNALTAAFTLLELFDFPPYLHLWDAHALWHMSTAILPLIFYRFVFDDLIYLQNYWPLRKTGMKST